MPLLSAQCVRKASLRISPLLVYSTLCPFLAIHGPILRWILSWASPLSRGHTVIFTTMDYFSKAAHFVPLPKLPSAAGTGALLVHYVFWLNGIPCNIVTDRGLQFTSQGWRSLLHSQFNGQTKRATRLLRTHFGASQPAILAPIAHSCHGWNIHSTCWFQPHMVFPLS